MDKEAPVLYQAQYQAQNYLPPPNPHPFFLDRSLSPSSLFQQGDHELLMPRRPLGPACPLASSGLGRGRK